MTLLFHAGHPQTSPQPTGLSRLERRERQPSFRSVDCPVLCGQGYTCGALGFCLWWQRICELGSDAHLYSFGSCTGVSLGSDSHFSSSTLLADVFLGCLHSSLGFGGIVGTPPPMSVRGHELPHCYCHSFPVGLLPTWPLSSFLTGAPKTHIGGAGVSARQVSERPYALGLVWCHGLSSLLRVIPTFEVFGSLSYWSLAPVSPLGVDMGFSNNGLQPLVARTTSRKHVEGAPSCCIDSLGVAAPPHCYNVLVRGHEFPHCRRRPFPSGLLTAWPSSSFLTGAPKTHIGGAGVSARQANNRPYTFGLAWYHGPSGPFLELPAFELFGDAFPLWSLAPVSSLGADEGFSGIGLQPHAVRPAHIKHVGEAPRRCNGGGSCSSILLHCLHGKWPATLRSHCMPDHALFLLAAFAQPCVPKRRIGGSGTPTMV